MPKIPDMPRMTNRGPAGLSIKLTDEQKSEIEINGKPENILRVSGKGRKNNITQSLRHLVVPVEDLVLDPMNARLHPERNIQAIMDSLVAYGQQKPIVVRKETRVVVAGNGTLEAMRGLGWTKAAASVESMSDADAIGYGLADNRSAELAKWDFEIVKRLDVMLEQERHPVIGWSDDEVVVIRRGIWSPPRRDTSYDFSNDGKALTLKFTNEQSKLLEICFSLIRIKEQFLGADSEDCLEEICKQWLKFVQG